MHIIIIVGKKCNQTSDSRNKITDSSIANMDWLVSHDQ